MKLRLQLGNITLALLHCLVSYKETNLRYRGNVFAETDRNALYQNSFGPFNNTNNYLFLAISVLLRGN